MGSSQAALAAVGRSGRRRPLPPGRPSGVPGGRRRAAGTLGQPFSCTWTGPYQTPASRISSAGPSVRGQPAGRAFDPGTRHRFPTGHAPRGSWGRPPTALTTAFVVCLFGGRLPAHLPPGQRLKFPVPLAAAPYPGRPRLSPLVAVRTPMGRQPSNATHRRASARCGRQRQEVEESDEEVRFGPGQDTSPQTQDQRQSPSNEGSLRSVRDFARKTSQELKFQAAAFSGLSAQCDQAAASS